MEAFSQLKFLFPDDPGCVKLDTKQVARAGGEWIEKTGLLDSETVPRDAMKKDVCLRVCQIFKVNRRLTSTLTVGLG